MKHTATILDKILDQKKVRLEKDLSIKPLAQLVMEAEQKSETIRDFYTALQKENLPAIIAEIKKASPSAGFIASDFDHKKIASEYENSGIVSAISVITEQDFFQGDLSFLKDVKERVSVPVLRKDFLFDEYHLYESYLAGADAILLIAMVLEHHELKKMIELATKLKMNCLVETHSVEEVKISVDAGARIIGVNARDLRTFQIDLHLFEKLAPLIPKECIKVAESGVESAQDVWRVSQAGANAVLVGTSIMKAQNKSQKIKELLAF